MQDAERKKNETSIRIADWNTETFFDSINSGSEYSEFLKSKTWGKDAYVKRLERLCSVIKTLNADVFVMEEIESEAVVQDISNFLAGEWDQKKIYAYGCFAKDEGSSIGCAVLSRFPLTNMKIHTIDIRSETEKMPSVRPLIEVTIHKNSAALVLLVAHWKSKSGGEQETEKWRNWQEELLAEEIALQTQQGNAVVACGDFNRDISCFTEDDDGQIVLGKKKSVTVFSPWILNDGSFVTPGSYVFDGKWERIDHFFVAGRTVCRQFEPATDGPWYDAAGNKPVKYELWNGSGYSDHLPITATISF